MSDLKLDTLKHKIRRKIEPVTMPVHAAYPIRRGSKISVVVNGEEIELHPLAAANIARAWHDALYGAYVSISVETGEHINQYPENERGD